MAVVLRKKSNAADGRFGRALRGLQRFPISALALLDRQSACLQSAALISKSAVSQTLFGLDQRLRRTLSAYDIIVLGISNSYIWKCPSTRLEDHYNKNISANHLDIGVGTGYFLDRCHFPVENPRVALMDMNTESLTFAARRIARYRPETYRQNVLEKITTSILPFDSVGVNYLFHCLPGAITDKTIVFDHLMPLMKPGARIFGSTILQGDVPRGWMARRLMAFYNKKGIFSNTQDDLGGLTASLEKRFDNVSIDVVGCVALFSAAAR